MAYRDDSAELQGLIDNGVGTYVRLPKRNWIIHEPITWPGSGTVVGFQGGRVQVGRELLLLATAGLRGLFEFNGGEASPIHINAGTSNDALDLQLTQSRTVAASLEEGSETITVAESGDALPSAPFHACLKETNQGSNGEWNIREWVYVTAVDGATLTIRRPLGRSFSASAQLRWKTGGANPLVDVGVEDVQVFGQIGSGASYTDFADIIASCVVGLRLYNVETHLNHGYAAELSVCDAIDIDTFRYGDSLDESGAGGTAYGIAIHGGRDHVLRGVGSVDAGSRRAGILIGGAHKGQVVNCGGLAHDASYSENNINSLDFHGKGEYDWLVKWCSHPQLTLGSHYRGCEKIHCFDSDFFRMVTIAPGADDVRLERVTGSVLRAVRRTTSGFDPDGSAKKIGGSAGIHTKGCEFISQSHDIPLLMHEVTKFTDEDSVFRYGHQEFGGSTVKKVPAAALDCWLEDGDPDTGGNQNGWPVRYGATIYSAAALGGGKNNPVAYDEGGDYEFNRTEFDNSLGDGTYAPVLVGAGVAGKAQDIASMAFNQATFKGKTAQAVHVQPEATGGVLSHDSCSYTRTGGAAAGIVLDDSGSVPGSQQGEPTLD